MKIIDEKSSKEALRPNFRDFSAYFPLFGPYSTQFGEISEKRRAEQSGAAYGPQVIAWQWTPLAAIVYRMDCGPAADP